MTFFENRRQLAEAEPQQKSSASPVCAGAIGKARATPVTAVGDEVLNNARPVINHGIKSGIGLAGWGTQMQGYEPTRSVTHRRTRLPGASEGRCRTTRRRT